MVKYFFINMSPGTSKLIKHLVYLSFYEYPSTEAYQRNNKKTIPQAAHATSKA